MRPKVPSMRRRPLALFAMVLPLMAAADPKEDHERIQGTWKVVSAEDSGRRTPDEAIKSLTLAVTKDAITYKVGDKTTRWTYRLHPEKKPKWVDLTEAGRVMPGIYELD